MVKCKYCGGNFEKFQMKTSNMCNICAYNKHHKESLSDTYKKFNKAIKLRL